MDLFHETLPRLVAEPCVSRSIPDTREFTHDPALDGLRGIAVLAVMFHHLGIFVPERRPWIPGGFLGVDIFFVLSGFLITAVLLREYSKIGTISLRRFYLRRVFRLVPAYWLFLGVLFFFGWLLLSAGESSVIYSDHAFLNAFAYVTNWNSAYGSTAGNLNHTWSLAIEEQFYLIWPLFLSFTLFRKWRPAAIVMTTLGVIVIIGFVRVARADAGTPIQVLYYSTESRIDSLLIGCVAGLIYMWQLIPQRVFRSMPFAVLTGLSIMMLAFIMVGYGYEDIETYRIFLPLFAISTAATILWISETNASGPLGLVLKIRPLRWTGKISYGLYLWHYLAYEVGREVFRDTSLQMILGCILAFSFAATSYYLIEKRFLKLKKRFETA